MSNVSIVLSNKKPKRAIKCDSLPLFVKIIAKNFCLSKLFPNFATSKTTRKMNKDFITLEESKDQLIGKVGTPERDAYEEDLKLYVNGASI